MPSEPVLGLLCPLREFYRAPSMVSGVGTRQACSLHGHRVYIYTMPVSIH